MNQKLFHLSKRKELRWYAAWGIRLAAILIALVVCGFVTTAMTGENPIAIYKTMWSGAFGTNRRIWITLQNLSLLLCVSLAVTPAFRMKFWNVGGEGQVLMGGLATAACMILLGGKLPNYLLIPLMLVCALAAGGIWGAIPAFFKAKWNTNETLFTLMMNYVATQIVAYFVIIWEVPKGSGKIGVINQSTQAGWLPIVGGQKYLLPVLVAAILTGLLYIYLNWTKHGYEISVVGESIRTARYVGIKVDRVIIRTMALSGALCGLAGLLLVGGSDHTIATATAGGRGFTAVMVSWMAKFNPVVMFFASFLICFLEKGAGQVANDCGIDASYADILTGIILFFIIGCEFFINYKISLRKTGGKEDK